MRPASEAFLRAVRGSHRMAARARVVEPGQTGIDPDGVEIAILGGDVALDAGADVRSTLDMTTEGRRAWPSASNLLLAPYGNEVFVERGIVLGGGRTEWVSLGYHRIDSPGQDRAPHGPIRLSGSDRMAGLIDARLLVPRQYTAGWTFGDVVDDLVTDVYPDAVIEWDDDTDTRLLGRAVIVEQDRHKFLADLVAAAGKVWHWDHRGHLVIRDLPDPAAPVFDVTGGAGGVLVSLARELSREGVYNAVVAQGEGTDEDPPARAVAVDDNPKSPTRFGGPFGQVPRYFTSPLLRTTAQCTAAATTMLRQGLGLPYRVNFEAVPNPALEPLDPVRVRTAGLGAETHVLNTLTVPLVASQALKAATREQTVVIIGTG